MLRPWCTFGAKTGLAGVERADARGRRERGAVVSHGGWLQQPSTSGLGECKVRMGQRRLVFFDSGLPMLRNSEHPRPEHGIPMFVCVYVFSSH